MPNYSFNAPSVRYDGPTANMSSPVQTVSGGTNWLQHDDAVNNYQEISYSGAIKCDGSLWLWGLNSWGALGICSTINQSSPVQTISGGTNWKQVSAGCSFSAAIKTDGSLWLWGNNAQGQLGTCTVTYHSSPVQTISGGTNWKQVSTSVLNGNMTAAIKTDGTLWLWGYGWSGSMGNNINSVLYSSPVQTISGGTNWKQVSVSNSTGSTSSVAAIKTDGTLWLWGSGSGGQLGNNLASDQSSPVQTISGGTDWKQVSSGGGYTAAIKTDGTLWSWGISQDGQLGISCQFAQSSPVQTISGGTNWKQVSAGVCVTSAIKTDGTLWSWGNGAYGALGNNSTVIYRSPVQTVAGGTNWKQVSAGSTAIKTDGTLWTWGCAINGRTGNCSTVDQFSPVQVINGNNQWKFYNPLLEPNNLNNWQEIAPNSAIKCDGTLWLWGPNSRGQLGNCSTIDQSSPVQTISGGTNWKQLSGSGFRTAAIKTDGTLWLWGCNSNGQHGNCSTIDQSSPVQTISGGTNWKQVSANLAITAAIKIDGSLWLWGWNNCGQLGTCTTIYHSSPVQTISGGTNWKQVSVGPGYNAAAIKCDGTLWLWGDNALGHLGINSTITHSSPVQTISGGTDWKQVSMGSNLAAAIKCDGTLWTWGYGALGQLGNCSTINQSSPVQTISGGTNWKQVNVGYWGNVAATKIDGSLWLWGCGAQGHLGNNSTINQSSPVQTVSGGTDWKQIAVGNATVMAVKCDRTLWTWGCNNAGQLGNCSTINQSSPVQNISNETKWRTDIDADDGYYEEFSSGWFRGAGIRLDGTLWLWGDNSYGQLGADSPYATYSIPTQTVSQGTTWKSVNMKYFTSYAIKCDGTLWTWGRGCYGLLGNNTTNNHSSPIQTISGGTNWKQVSAGDCHVAAIKTDGTLWLWGSGIYGSLGNNSAVDQSSPVQTISGDYNWKQVSAGDDLTAAIKTDGTLWLWGYGATGALGNCLTIHHSSPVQTISGGTNWKQVSASADTIAAIKTDGTLWLWGDGTSGKLGNNSTIWQSSPVQTISGGTNWKQVSGNDLGFVGTSFSTGPIAAVKCDGTLWGWGPNGGGQLGNNSTIDQSSPVQTISGGTDWKQVSAGGTNILAIKCDGTLLASGNADGLGANIGTNGYKSSPVQVISGGTMWRSTYGYDKQDIDIKVTSSYAAIKSDGTLWTWGCGLWGAIGDGQKIHRSSPVQTISGGTNWKQVSAVLNVTTAIKTDGTLWTWGYNTYGQLGTNSTEHQSSPVQTISGGTNWKQVSVGSNGTAAVKCDGSLWLWGRGIDGLLGNNSTDNQSSPVQTISGGTNWKQVSACTSIAAIKCDGSLWLWGCGVTGSLGNNAIVNQSSPVQTISGGTNWKQVSISDQGTAAIKTDGSLWLWGWNSAGRLGNNAIVDQSSPVQTISGGNDWKQVSTNSMGTQAIKCDGTLWVWGCGIAGQLGNNSTINQSSPVQTISGGTNWKQVNMACATVSAVKTDGTLWIWGCGIAGSLGNNSTINQSSPVQQVVLSDWKFDGPDPYPVEYGEVSGTAAIKTDGSLWLWGRGNILGNNDGSVTDQSSPVQTISGGYNWKQVSVNSDHAAAIKTDGSLWLWGGNGIGQLGHNKPAAGEISPVQTISGGTNWKQVSVGGTDYDGSTAAIKTDGSLWLWGVNRFGTLGNCSTIDQSSPVQTISGGTNWKQVSMGGYHTAAIKTDGTLWTWGNNSWYAGLGTNSTIDQSSPVQTISGGTNWKQVSATENRTAAIKTDGTLWLWGYYALGNNSTIWQSSPVQTISGGTDWKQVSVGIGATAAIKTDGTLWMWGDGTCGALGNNSTIYHSSPVQTISGGTNWKQVSLGVCDANTTSETFTAVKTDGTLWTWGYGGTGSLGNNSTISRSSPVQVLFTPWRCDDWEDSQFDEISGSAAIKTDGSLWLWGSGAGGVLGNNSTISQSSPVQTISGGTNWKQVSVGEFHVAAIKTDGSLWLWGGGTAGKLGNNSTVNQSSPVQTISGGNNWKQVSANDFNTAAIKTDGSLWLWGLSDCGQLGNNSTITQSSPVQTISGGTNWKQVSVGKCFIVAIKTDGTLWGWGEAWFGQLGNCSIITQSSPVQTISGGTNWKQVSAGGTCNAVAYTAAVKCDGSLWTWGQNAAGQLGNNSTIAVSSPVQTISGGSNWKQVSVYNGNTIAIKTDGTLWGWGCGTSGQLGNCSTINRSSPVQTISGGTNWKQVSSGAGQTAAIKTDGTLWLWGCGTSGALGRCDSYSYPVVNKVNFDDIYVKAELFDKEGGLWGWGANYCGTLGNNSTINQSSPVQTISGGTNWKQVSAGNSNTAAIKTDGSLWLWGNGMDGQMGNSNRNYYSSPVQTISGGTNWKQVSADGPIAAIKTDGSLWLWGCNVHGQLGNNSTINQSSPVQTISGGTNWKQVSTNYGFNAAAVKTDGTLWTWGSNGSGQLGNCSTVHQSSPVQTISGGTNWKQVSVGSYHTAAIKTDGSLWLWGDGSYGRLGNCSIINQSSPVQTISGGTNWKQVDAGPSFLTAAIKTDGSLWTWGIGTQGTLGNNSTIDQSSPVQTISGGTNWKQVSAGNGTTSAIKTDGSLWLWGCGNNGRLGSCSTIDQSSPVQTISGGTNWKQVSETFAIREGCW